MKNIAPAAAALLLLLAAGARADSWTQALSNAQKNGRFTPADPPIMANFGLADVRGPADGPHAADYFSVFGFVSNADGLFHPGGADVVSEKWALDEKGNWSIEHWVYRVTMSRAVVLRLHEILHESRGHQILGTDDLGPGTDAALQSLIDRWAAAKPAATERRP